MNNRFQDNTSVRPVDRVRRYGYAAGIQNMAASPLGTNLPGDYVPQGTLLLFTPRVDNYMDKNFAWTTKETSPAEFAKRMEDKFQNGESDMGYRTLHCLTDLPYDRETGRDEADVYWDTVNTVYSCEMGLETGKNDPCPTCRLEWLESADCTAKLIDARDNGLDIKVLEDLRLTLIDAHKAALRFAKYKYDYVKKDVDAGKMQFGEAELHFAKMMHKREAHIEAAELVTKQAELQGNAIAQGIAQAMAAQKESERIAELEAKLAALEKAQAEAKEPKKVK